jgi:ketosteroid isomerase-like protein
MRGRITVTLALGAVLALRLTPVAADTAQPGDLVEQVRAAETAFAQTMAARDHAAFGDFIADEGVFFSSRDTLRGAAAVREGWKRFFAGAEAPFSWRPETVEVLPSGTLALSSGPVLDPSGAPAGVFTSIWRLEADGKWRVVFDRGCPPCECPEKP